jgi:hypothetical protein
MRLRAAAQNSAAFSITSVVIGAYPSLAFNASKRVGPAVLAGPKQFTAHFVVSDLGYHNVKASGGQLSQPVFARLIFRGFSDS